jgi:hypothetical protein
VPTRITIARESVDVTRLSQRALMTRGSERDEKKMFGVVLKNNAAMGSAR